MTHATLSKFGYPSTLLKELEHWCILLRPAQATLGALVLCAKSDVTSLSALPPAAFAELHAAISAIERALSGFRPYAKINYMALMMVDPQVHFHVLPRYPEAQDFAGTTFPDPGFPGLPDLKSSPAVTAETFVLLHSALAEHFQRTV